ncbi:LETM1-related biofilm-associated protein [Joostella sp. CR20]|uniref:LETM1-related biofilm-associated protein n=1 Tax=Joostella sp. CR20 TaxID=2804312 RepID=UPI00313A7ECE
MNPSAQGWINKFASLTKSKKNLYTTSKMLYNKLREIGFVYGANVATFEQLTTANDLSEDELAKLNLFAALHNTFYIYNPDATFEEFLQHLISFYEQLEAEKLSFFETFFAEKRNAFRLEKIIHERVYILDNILTKNFNKLLTNSLLYIDILVYEKYIKGESNLRNYAQEIELILINLALHAISTKQEKNENDKQLLKLLQASLFYNKIDESKFDGSYRILLKKDFSELEKMYFLDMVCLSAWEDHSINYQESEFIFGTGKDLKIDENYITEAVLHVGNFFEKYKDEVSLFKNANPVKQFFDNSHTLVKKLITRNSKRLKKELLGSKELLVLLGKSTTTDLTAEERKKIKEQLLDIFKTIPSLAIFALPGGAILLPIFIKLIPKMLPSAFDDNRVDEV